MAIYMQLKGSVLIGFKIPEKLVTKPVPVAEEFVLFNRSWYNRADVKRGMGFCSNGEHEEFMLVVPRFEEMLVHSGIKLREYYLDIGKGEQVRCLADRKNDSLK